MPILYGPLDVLDGCSHPIWTITNFFPLFPPLSFLFVVCAPGVVFCVCCVGMLRVILNALSPLSFRFAGFGPLHAASGMTVNRHRRSHTPHARLTFSLHNTTLYLSFSLFLSLALNLPYPDCLGFGCALVLKNNFACKGAWPN